MCVNDILTHGAEPLFFMQCLNSGKLNRNIIVDVVSGIANGCKEANCALISKYNNINCKIFLDIFMYKTSCGIHLLLTSLLFLNTNK